MQEKAAPLREDSHTAERQEHSLGTDPVVLLSPRRLHAAELATFCPHCCCKLCACMTSMQHGCLQHGNTVLVTAWAHVSFRFEHR